MECMENFEIRTYGRTELALCYFPDLNPQVAYRKLQYWIDYYPHLREQLEKMGSGLSCRTYMPAQVQLIVGARKRTLKARMRSLRTGVWPLFRFSTV